MEYYSNLGPHVAAHENNHMECADFTETSLTQLDDLARQLEWEILTGIDTKKIHDSEQNLDPSESIHQTVVEPSPFSFYFENNAAASIIEPQLLLGSPDTYTTAITRQTSPIPAYELPGHWDTFWDTGFLNMIPGGVSVPFDTAFEWAMMDGSWLEEGLNSATAEEAMSLHKLSKVSKSCGAARHDAAISSSAYCLPSEGTSTNYTCTFCPFTAASSTKLKTHINKHTRPFRCTAPSCDYATAEKKTLHRHVLAKAKYDQGHCVIAEGLGIRTVKHKCIGLGCEYVTIREDNLRRHVMKCPAMKSQTSIAE